MPHGIVSCIARGSSIVVNGAPYDELDAASATTTTSAATDLKTSMRDDITLPPEPRLDDVVMVNRRNVTKRSSRRSMLERAGSASSKSIDCNRFSSDPSTELSDCVGWVLCEEVKSGSCDVSIFPSLGASRSHGRPFPA